MEDSQAGGTESPQVSSSEAEDPRSLLSSGNAVGLLAGSSDAVGQSSSSNDDAGGGGDGKWPPYLLATRNQQQMFSSCSIPGPSLVTKMLWGPQEASIPCR